MELENMLAQALKERDEWRLNCGKIRVLLERVQHLPGFKDIVDEDLGDELLGEVLATNYHGVSQIIFLSDDMAILDEARLLIKALVARQKD